MALVDFVTTKYWHPEVYKAPAGNQAWQVAYSAGVQEVDFVNFFLAIQ